MYVCMYGALKRMAAFAAALTVFGVSIPCAAAEPEKPGIPSDYCWVVDDATFIVGQDETVRIPVRAYQPIEAIGYEFRVKVDGKPLEEAGFRLVSAEQGEVYPSEYFPNFSYVPETGLVGTAWGADVHFRPTKDGMVLAYLELAPVSEPEHLIGTSIAVSLTDVMVGSYIEEWRPRLVPGTLTFAASPGDADWSGSVDILDVICVNKFLLGTRELDEPHRVSADLDGDSNVTETDALAILKAVLKN